MKKKLHFIERNPPSPHGDPGHVHLHIPRPPISEGPKCSVVLRGGGFGEVRRRFSDGLGRRCHREAAWRHAASQNPHWAGRTIPRKGSCGPVCSRGSSCPTPADRGPTLIQTLGAQRFISAAAPQSPSFPQGDVFCRTGYDVSCLLSHLS